MAHLVSHPVQYLVPIYREIAKHPDIELTVYFYSDKSLGKHHDAEFGMAFEWSTPLLGGYDSRFVDSSKGKLIKGALAWPNWDLLAEVGRNNYDVLWINSYVGTNAWLARFRAMLSRTPVFFRDDTNLLTPRPWWKRALKWIFLRSFLYGAWALYVGQENKRYWRYYGIPERRLCFSPHCVDNAVWKDWARKLAPERAAIRRKFGITDDRPVILFCAKFIPKKQPLLLLAAFAELIQRVSCWLVMVGDGELKPAVEAQIREQGLKNVLLPGFLNQDEIPRAYTAADIFVLPSLYNETWGLVVNEAMNFELPIVVSDRVGCGHDLVKDGWNGFVFAHDKPGELADRLETLVRDPELRSKFGLNGAKLVDDYSVELCAQGIVQAGLAAAAAK